MRARSMRRETVLTMRLQVLARWDIVVHDGVY